MCVWCGLHRHTGIMRDAGIPLAAPAVFCHLWHHHAGTESPIWRLQRGSVELAILTVDLYISTWLLSMTPKLMLSCVFFPMKLILKTGKHYDINGKMWQDLHWLFDSYLVQCLSRNGAFHNLRNDVVRLWYDICFSTSLFGILYVAKYK